MTLTLTLTHNFNAMNDLFFFVISKTLPQSVLSVNVDLAAATAVTDECSVVTIMRKDVAIYRCEWPSLAAGTVRDLAPSPLF